MDLNRSDWLEKVQKLLKKNTVKEVKYHVKTENVHASFVVQIYDKENDTTIVYTGYARYEIFYS